MRPSRLIGVGILSAVLLVAACDQVNFTAPTGSTITITAQPPTIARNGVSNITVTGTRASGAPLPDGTAITFTSTLGTVDPNPAETKDGVAFARFHPGTRSGTATITASSGSAAAVTVDVVIGEARANKLILTANPVQLPIGGGRVTLKAHVFDEVGNSLPGMGVIFETDKGQLDSRGNVVQTNSSGVASDVLVTHLAATITATAVGGSGPTDQTSIGIGEALPCTIVTSPSEAFKVGQEIIFSDPNGIANNQLQFFWDFGDGSPAEKGQTVTHAYAVEGSYTVTHTVLDRNGNSTSCSAVIAVNLDAPVCSFTVSPSTPVEGNNVSFDASLSSDTSGIANFKWNFGDGTTQTTTSPFTNHVYVFPDCNAGTLSVQVGLEVTDNTGQTSFCAQTLTFTCN